MIFSVGTSRDSRDMAYLLGLRCPDFLKRSRDSRDKLSNAVQGRPPLRPLLQSHVHLLIAATLKKFVRDAETVRRALATR